MGTLPTLGWNNTSYGESYIAFHSYGGGPSGAVDWWGAGTGVVRLDHTELLKNIPLTYITVNVDVDGLATCDTTNMPSNVVGIFTDLDGYDVDTGYAGILENKRYYIVPLGFGPNEQIEIHVDCQMDTASVLGAGPGYTFRLAYYDYRKTGLYMVVAEDASASSIVETSFCNVPVGYVFYLEPGFSTARRVTKVESMPMVNGQPRQRVTLSGTVTLSAGDTVVCTYKKLVSDGGPDSAKVNAISPAITDNDIQNGVIIRPPIAIANYTN